MTLMEQVRYKADEQAMDAVDLAVHRARVVILSGVDPAIDWHKFYTRLSDRLGRVVGADEDLHTGQSTGERWISVEYDPEIPDRYRTAKVHQPLHTDESYLPLDNSLTFFYCRARAPRGGATTFLDAQDLVDLLVLDNETELLQDLQTTPVCFSKAGNQRTRPILIRDALGWSLNFNYFCVDAANPPDAKRLAERLHTFLEQRVRASGIPTAVELGPGEAIFFHDQRVLHGRNAFFATTKGDRALVKGSVLLDPATLGPAARA